MKAQIEMHWRVIGPGSKPRHTLCQCVCGKTKEVRKDHLSSMRSTSCGCAYGPHNYRHGHAKHGQGRTQTYGTWAAMIRRCENPNAVQYKYYGGRGIEVCERWKLFENFLEDMGHRPDGKTIDRINPDGNYEPCNCRWADKIEQRANRRDSNGQTT